MKYLLNKYKIFLIIYLPIFIFLVVIGSYRTNYSVTTTGSITKISSYISIDTTNSCGDINSVFVYSQDHSTIFQNWCGRLDKNAEVEKLGNNYSKFSDSEIQLMGKIQHNQSIESSVIKAYTYAMNEDSEISIDYEFKGLIVNYLIISDNMQFKIGDIITSINGYSSYEEIKNEYKNMYEGSSVEILRGDKKLLLTLNADSSVYDVDGVKYGHISVYDKFEIKSTTPKITISSVNSSGPSAGLMQTIAIYNMLVSNDITFGRRISGTGTIDVSSNVGIIGGIKEKVVAAYKRGVEIFLCPEDNYEEAMIQYNKLGKKRNRLKIYSVSTFEAALEVLYA